MQSHTLDDLLDRLVAQYAERLARGEKRDPSDLLAQVSVEHRAALERCFRMMQAGIASAPPVAAPLGPGSALDNFEIVRELGRGGMAVVYLATQRELARPVALKVLRPGLALEARHVDRFRREALAVARLRHPHIVQVYAVGSARGYHYLAMEYVEGQSLADVYEQLPKDGSASVDDLARLTGAKFPNEATSFERALCALLAPVARALGVAHELGIVHRDVKPSNILIHKDGRAVIADFGLAKGEGDPGLSLSGEPLGTPFYMSPEQATLTEHAVDQRTDVYSLGVTLYEGLTGRRPFEGDTVLAVLERLKSGVVPSVRSVAKKCSRDADAVVRRAMARKPDDRYPTALEFAIDLQAIAQGNLTQASVREGSALRRGWRTIGALMRSELDEYRSSTEFLGLPLVHIVRTGPRGKRMPVAKAWFAFGQRALGVFAWGGFSCGVFAFGGFSLGLFAFGGFAMGLIALGGFAGGLVAFGGFAAGYAAVGGEGAGYYVLAGRAWGAHVISATVHDPLAIEWFKPWLPLLHHMPGGEHLDELLR